MWHALPGESFFKDDIDRQRFLQELAFVASKEKARILGHSEMTTHNHLHLQSGDRGLPAFMQRLGRRYASAFNHRHGRRGPTIWGRYTSKRVIGFDYTLRVLRYVHRNPVKARIVTFAELANYPWTGHAALLGNRRATFQESDLVLSWFGTTTEKARASLIDFMRDPSDDDDESFEHGNETKLAPATHVLGSDTFADAQWAKQTETNRRRFEHKQAGRDLDWVLAWASRRFGVAVRQIESGDRNRRVSAARAICCYFASRDLGMPLTQLSKRLSITVSAVSLAVQRGRALADSLGLDTMGDALAQELTAGG